MEALLGFCIGASVCLFWRLLYVIQENGIESLALWKRVEKPSVASTLEEAIKESYELTENIDRKFDEIKNPLPISRVQIDASNEFYSRPKHPKEDYSRRLSRLINY